MSPGIHGQAVVKAEKMALRENCVTLLMLLVRLSLMWNIDFFFLDVSPSTFKPLTIQLPSEMLQNKYIAISCTETVHADKHQQLLGSR